MKKFKSVYVCQECGYESAGWLGKCPSCMGWNTLVEEQNTSGSGKSLSGKKETIAININDIILDNEERIITDIGELDRVLGGGMVKGSLVLVGGDPGIGKSTLLLQMCSKVKTNADIYYISGEESAKQIKIRADRLDVKNPKLMMAAETNFESIRELLEKKKPSVAIIDSIQTMYSEDVASAPGSVSQVRQVTTGLMSFAKTTGTTVVIVGHVTKEGALAGPRVLEHMVDAVLYFEGERHQSYRVLRAVKNRFGSTNEIGIFEMRDTGLWEVGNPSAVMLSGRPEKAPGSAVASSIEGTRPMLVEIQALVSPTAFGVPRRMATGADFNRITMIMAVLEKVLGMQLHNHDAYLNVVGGIKIDEPACDLAIAAAIASSFRNAHVDEKTVLIGEVGLTGELRAVNQLEKRITESIRLGFTKCIVPTGSLKGISGLKELGEARIIEAETLTEALDLIL